MRDSAQLSPVVSLGGSGGGPKIQTKKEERDKGRDTGGGGIFKSTAIVPHLVVTVIIRDIMMQINVSFFILPSFCYRLINTILIHPLVM